MGPEAGTVTVCSVAVFTTGVATVFQFTFGSEGASSRTKPVTSTGQEITTWPFAAARIFNTGAPTLCTNLMLCQKPGSSVTESLIAAMAGAASRCAAVAVKTNRASELELCDPPPAITVETRVKLPPLCARALMELRPTLAAMASNADIVFMTTTL